MPISHHRRVQVLRGHLTEQRSAALEHARIKRVAAHFAENGEIVINRGAPWRGRDDVKVKASRGGYDAEDYARQVAGGAV